MSEPLLTDVAEDDFATVVVSTHEPLSDDLRIKIQAGIVGVMGEAFEFEQGRGLTTRFMPVKASKN